MLDLDTFFLALHPHIGNGLKLTGTDEKRSQRSGSVQVLM